MNSNLINFRNRSICGLALAWVLLTSQSAVGGLITISGDEVTFDEVLSPAAGWTQIFDFGDMSGNLTDITYTGQWINEAGGVTSFRDDLVVLLQDQRKITAGRYETVLALGSSDTIGTSSENMTVNRIGVPTPTGTATASVLFWENSIEARWVTPTNNGTSTTGTDEIFTMGTLSGYSAGGNHQTISALPSIGDSSNFRAYIGHGYTGATQTGQERNTRWDGTLTIIGSECRHRWSGTGASDRHDLRDRHDRRGQFTTSPKVS